MKHKKWLEALTDEEVLQLIKDLEVLHFETGQLPDDSKIRELGKIVSEDFKIPFNLTTTENQFNWEVFRRFKKLYSAKSV